MQQYADVLYPLLFALSGDRAGFQLFTLAMQT